MRHEFGLLFWKRFRDDSAIVPHALDSGLRPASCRKIGRYLSGINKILDDKIGSLRNSGIFDKSELPTGTRIRKKRKGASGRIYK
jgi:hypothetical protein